VEEQGVPAETLVRSGRPSIEVLAAAADISADLIAMSTHGRRSRPGGRRGSTADKILRIATLPVLTAGPGTSPLEEGRAHFRRILVPLDGSPEAEAAVELAVELGRALGADVELFRVVTRLMGHYGMEPPAGYPFHLDEKREREARAYLREIQQRYPEVIPEIRTCVGLPAADIRSAVDSGDYDLVVMTSRGRYGREAWSLGSVADEVIEGPTPVIVLPPSR
jgi:nucleotide-binding universal stress UspA family protein